MARTIKGLKMLPITLPEIKALDIYRKVSSVNEKIGRLDELARHSIVNKSIMQVLSLQEAVESTRIEGTQVTFTEMVNEQHDRKPRWEIIEVINYRKALNKGVEIVKNGYPVTTRLFKDLHRILMEDARGSDQASGEFRKIQNFIGPTNNIKDASYIPVPSNEIDNYMENLEMYINGSPYGQKLEVPIGTDTSEYLLDESQDDLIKTAIFHAQFESIHPFLDGNGRLGRILILLHLIQTRKISLPILFVSEELEKEQYRYYDMLNRVRGEDPDWASWILFFLNACDRATNKLTEKLKNAEELATEGLRQLKNPNDQNVWLHTFSDPSTTAKVAAKELNLNPNTTRKSLKLLAEKGMIFENTEKQRNKDYRNYDLLRILQD